MLILIMLSDIKGAKSIIIWRLQSHKFGEENAHTAAKGKPPS